METQNIAIHKVVVVVANIVDRVVERTNIVGLAIVEAIDAGKVEAT